MLVMFVLLNTLATAMLADELIQNVALDRPRLAPEITHATVRSIGNVAQRQRHWIVPSRTLAGGPTRILLGKRTTPKRNPLGTASSESFDSTSIGLGDFEASDLNSHRVLVRGNSDGASNINDSNNNNKRSYSGPNRPIPDADEEPNADSSNQQQEQQQLALRALQDQVLRRVANQSLMEDFGRGNKLRSQMRPSGSNLPDPINNNQEPGISFSFITSGLADAQVPSGFSVSVDGEEEEENEAIKKGQDGTETGVEPSMIQLVRRRKQLKWPRELQAGPGIER